MSYLLPCFGGKKEYANYTSEDVDKLNSLLETECMKQVISCLLNYKQPKRTPTLFIWLNNDTLEVYLTMSLFSSEIIVEMRKHIDAETNKGILPTSDGCSMFKLEELNITPNADLLKVISREDTREGVKYLGAKYDVIITDKRFSITKDTTITQLIQQIEMNYEKNLATFEKEQNDVSNYWKRLLSK